ELLVHDELLHGRQAGAAVLLGPGGGDPAALRQGLAPPAHGAAFKLEAGPAGTGLGPALLPAALIVGERGVVQAVALLDLLWQLLLQELPHFLAPRSLFRRVCDPHRPLLLMALLASTVSGRAPSRTPGSWET